MNTAQPKEAEPHAQLMAPAIAGAYLGGIVISTLAKWRHYGRGPAYCKIGSRIMYRRADLDAWIEQNRRQSTSAAA